MPFDMTPDRWRHTSDYLDEVFGRQDEHLAGLMSRAIEAGIPDIAVSASVGRMLLALARLVDAKLIIEVGTLAGYSGIWLARGLSAGGRLLTIEPEEKHAAFAEQMFEEAGVADRAEVVRGFGTPVLEAMARERAGTADVVFLDAIKSEYPDYLPHARMLLRPGGLLIADNMLGSGDWWIDTPEGENEHRDAADRVNRLVAGDEGFEAFCVPLREGVMVARKK